MSPTSFQLLHPAATTFWILSNCSILSIAKFPLGGKGNGHRTALCRLFTFAQARPGYQIVTPPAFKQAWRLPLTDIHHGVSRHPLHSRREPDLPQESPGRPLGCRHLRQARQDSVHRKAARLQRISITTVVLVPRSVGRLL